MYQLWKSIKDIIGDASKWSQLIRRLFWTRNINQFQRSIVAAFVSINGLNPEIFLEWVEKQFLCRDKKTFKHFRILFKEFEEGHYFNMYGYTVSNNRYEHIVETVRIYQPAQHRQ